MPDANIPAGRSTAEATKAVRHYQPKELCVVWLPERGGYFQGTAFQAINGKTVHNVRTCNTPAQATVYDGDRATQIAEQIMRQHGLKPVLRTHYRNPQPTSTRGSH